MHSKGKKKPEARSETELRTTTSSKMAKVVFTPPSMEGFLRWASSFETSPRPAFIVLSGRPSQRLSFLTKYRSSRYDSYRPGSVEDLIGAQTQDWLQQGVSKNLTTRVCSITLPTECRSSLPNWFPPEAGFWELLWGLVAVEDLILDEPLRSMLDQDSYVIYDVYRMLWEARFLAKENDNLAPAQAVVRTMVRWLTTPMLSTEDEARLHAAGVRRRITLDQRSDVLIFILTLNAQNSLINRYLIAFDKLEQATEDHKPALRELYRLLTSLERWIKMGPSPIGVVLGHTADPTDLHNLRQIDERLAEKISAGLDWKRST